MSSWRRCTTLPIIGRARLGSTALDLFACNGDLEEVEPYRSSGEVVLNGIAGGRAARGNAQFAVDGAEVCMYGARAEHQRFRYPVVGKALRHQAHHLHLSSGQPSWLGC